MSMQMNLNGYLYLTHTEFDFGNDYKRLTVTGVHIRTLVFFDESKYLFMRDAPIIGATSKKMIQ